MLQAEDERLSGESVEDGVIRVYKKLEKAVDMLKRQQPKPDDGPNIQTAPFAPTTIPTINIDHERMEIEIDNCLSIEELVLWKGNHEVLPGKIVAYYTERLKTLSNIH